MEKHKRRKNTCSKNLTSIRKKAETEAEENKPQLVCKICKKIFSRKDALQTHQKNINCNSLQLKQCKFCLKIFASLKGKYKHYKNVKCVPNVIT
jgi:two-component SAPR family response regulator